MDLSMQFYNKCKMSGENLEMFMEGCITKSVVYQEQCTVLCVSQLYNGFSLPMHSQIGTFLEDQRPLPNTIHCI